MVPGPQPMSRREKCGRRCGSRKAALFETVRAECEAMTSLECPWEYVDFGAESMTFVAIVTRYVSDRFGDDKYDTGSGAT